ncbi:hypothetical protein KP509_09G028000 [Ceratopteris richardii]|uniref:Uncharacterized protein n=1 Tax=Ceratopteris richardii TaxID=49495 RepID=A0A8T2U1A8_CERRI|nr:hypothetical protein KP509_09G028000 [Ceratopteris richardii]
MLTKIEGCLKMFLQQEENAQACYNGVVLNMSKRSIHDIKWFPFSNSKQTYFYEIILKQNKEYT